MVLEKKNFFGFFHLENLLCDQDMQRTGRIDQVLK